MFLPTDYQGWRTEEDGQEHVKGRFIMLFQQKWDAGTAEMPRELRVLVRAVQLDQAGNFMTGRVKIKCPDQTEVVALSLSGAFGNDNLPITCPERLWKHLHPVPQELADQFWTTPAGNESRAGSAVIFEWVRTHADNLQRLQKHDKTEGPAESD